MIEEIDKNYYFEQFQQGFPQELSDIVISSRHLLVPKIVWKSKCLVVKEPGIKFSLQSLGICLGI